MISLTTKLRVMSFIGDDSSVRQIARRSGVREGKVREALTLIATDGNAHCEAGRWSLNRLGGQRRFR